MWSRISFQSLSGYVCNLYSLESGEVGDRGTVLFLHGWGDHGGRYHSTGERIHQAGFRVLIPEFTGHGLSSGPRGRVDDFSILIEDLHSLVKSLAGPVFLVGHSMGGCLAFHYALRYPERLTGLVFNSAALGVSPRIPQWKRWLTRRLGTWVPHVKLLQLKAAHMMTSVPAQQRTYDQDSLLYHGKLEFGTGLALMQANNECAQQLEAFCARNLPILVLQGSDDELVDPHAAQRLYAAQSHPGSQMKLYDARHDLLHDYVAEEVTQQMLAWLLRCTEA